MERLARTRLLATGAACTMSAFTVANAIVMIWLARLARTVTPREFHAWASENVERLGSLMEPFGAATVATSVVAAAARKDRKAFVSMPISSLAAFLAITGLINLPINRRLASGRVSEAETGQLRRRWLAWHGLRVLLLGVGSYQTWRAAR